MTRMSDAAKAQRAANRAAQTRREYVMVITLPRLPSVYGDVPIEYEPNGGLLIVDGVIVRKRRGGF